MEVEDCRFPLHRCDLHHAHELPEPGDGQGGPRERAGWTSRTGRVDLVNGQGGPRERASRPRARARGPRGRGLTARGRGR